MALLGLLACREPYQPDIEGFEELLVIEGRITDDTAGSRVRLSWSYGFEEGRAEPVAGASVRFEAADGSSYELPEEEPGLYRSQPADFMPVAGQSYRLLVNPPWGGAYASSFERLKVAPPIESVGYTFDTRLGADRGEVLEGLQMEISTGDPSGNTRFYQWTYDETYEFFVPYPIFERWDWSLIPPQGVAIPREEETRRCWRFAESAGILLASTRQLQADVIRRLPLYFLDAASGKVYWDYSVRVKQYALSEAEYAYLETMKQNTETTGSLFDPIPAEVRGNIQDLNNPDRPVIGYFGASTVSEYRLFIDRTAFPDSVRRRRPFSNCVPDTVALNIDDLRSTGMPGSGQVWYDTLYVDGIFPAGFLLVSPSCGDCKLTGSPDRPPYWPN